MKSEIIDKYCFVWSILAKLHPISDSKNGHSTRASNYRQYFDEFKINGFDFSKRFKYSDMHRFEKLSSIYINVFELNFYPDQKKHKLTPIEISKNKSDRVIDLII